MSKVSVIAKSQAKPGKEDEVKREFLRLVAETRKEEGCINYDLHQSADDKSVFLFYENWVSREHLDRHAQSAHITAFRAKSQDLLAGRTEITLWEMLNEPATAVGEQTVNKVTVAARLQAVPSKETEVKRELLQLVTETRKEGGCLNYDLHQSADNKSVFLFYENWVSRAHLDKHLQSAHLSAFIAKAADLLVAPAEVTFWKMASEPSAAAASGG